MFPQDKTLRYKSTNRMIKVYTFKFNYFNNLISEMITWKKCYSNEEIISEYILFWHNELAPNTGNFHMVLFPLICDLRLV